MKTRRSASLSALLLCWLVIAGMPAGGFGAPQEKKGEAAAEKKPAHPMTADGKRLFTAMDTLAIRAVGPGRLSPDGMRVVYTVSETPTDKPDEEWKSTTQVWVVSTAGGPARQYTQGEKSATNPAWSPDGKSIAFLTNREKERERQVWMMRVEGGEAWQVTSHKGGVSGFAFSPDSKKLLLAAADQPSKDEEARTKVKDDAKVTDEDFKMTHLWLWDIEKKDEKRLTEGAFTVTDPQWSPEGGQIAFVARPTPRADDGSLADIWVLNVASGEKKLLVQNPGPDTDPRWSPDGKWIAYVGSPDASGGPARAHLYVVAPGGGVPREITASFELDADTPFWSADGKSIYFSTEDHQASELFACDVAAGTVKQLTHMNGVLVLRDAGKDGTLVATFHNPQRPAEIFRARTSAGPFEPLTEHNAWLANYALGSVEVLRWKSRDGMEIEGVLTKPLGFQAGKKYPLLLNPHGGPTGASLTGFNSTAQLMAANGYLVLQPNFRGSSGRGEKFAQANKNTWGIGDYEDCMTGVDEVLRRGWADADRLGAFGWSYGGYMTFWILTQTDRFKAVSPGAGLTNIYSMYSQNDIQRYLRWFYADKSPWENFQLYWDRSPMKCIEQVKTPTLILHGQNDTRVPIAQAQEFYRGLVERHVPVEFVVYPREGHGFTEPRHLVDRLRRYVSFFGKYVNNPPVTEPAPATEKADSN